MFGQIIGQFCKFQCFAGIGRLEHRELGRYGVMAGILLVLRAVHTCIVRNADNHTCVNAGICDCENRVGCNVESDVLH